MKRIVLFLTFLLLPLASYAEPPTPPSGMGWVKVWSDEFDGRDLDTTKWGLSKGICGTPRYHDGHRINWRYEDDNVSVLGTVLRLKNTRRRIDTETDEVSVAAVSTENLFEKTYGYFEAGISVAPARWGINTSFRLRSQGQTSTSANGGVDGGSDGAEITVAESLHEGSNVRHGIRWDGDAEEEYQTIDKAVHNWNYHIFGVQWNSEGYRFYVDGEPTWEYSGDGVSKSNQFIVLSTEVASDGGNAHTGKFYNFAQVDWVRVWELRDEADIPLTASFVTVPEEHDGSTPFAFTVLFSEPLEDSWRVVKNEAFEIAGGKIKRVRRVNRRKDLWDIFVKPTGDYDIDIVLPENRACDAVGGLCTAEGKVLSNRLKAVVSGPEGNLGGQCQ